MAIMNIDTKLKQTSLTDALDGFTPSNGAMIVCCNGTGEYVKRDDYLSLELKLQEAERQRDEANEHLDSTNISCNRAEAERDQLIKVVDKAVIPYKLQSIRTHEIQALIDSYSILPHVQAKKENKQ
jgi:hypothetical protein